MMLGIFKIVSKMVLIHFCKTLNLLYHLTSVRFFPFRELVLALVLGTALPLVSYAALPEPETQPPHAGQWEEFGSLVIPLPTANGITLRIITDIGVIAPTYQSFPRDNDLWIENFASEHRAANRSFRDLLEASGWGHIAPYVYAATYHALGRIFIGFSSNPVLADGMRLLPKDALQPGEIRIKVYLDCPAYEKAAVAAQMEVSPEAFYDDGKRQVEFCLPSEAIAVLQSLQQLYQSRPEIAIGQTQEFVNWLVLKLAAHELTHAIQQGTKANAYRFAFIREGGAMFLADNVVNRDAYIQLPRPTQSVDLAKLKVCEEAFQSVPPYKGAPSPMSVDQLRLVATHVRNQPHFSITKLLDDSTFRAGKPAVHYALAFVFQMFLRDADKALLVAWRRVSTSAGAKTDSADLAAIDQGFVRYVEELPWWEKPDAEVLAHSNAVASTECKRHGFFYNAHIAALRVNAYAPVSPLGLVYDGDVYWQVGKFFVALDRYRSGAALLREGDPYSAWVQSRLGDAFEQLGNIDGALHAYRAAAARPVPVAFATTLMRGDLKMRYYEGTRTDGTWATQASRDRLQGYIKDFQLPEAVAEINRRCKDEARFEDCMANLMSERFVAVSTRMKADLEDKHR
jgi:hypothetical protein